MKRIIYLTILFFITIAVSGQNTRTQTISVSYSPWNANSILQKTNSNAPTHAIDYSNYISIGYLSKISEMLSIESGIDYAYYRVETTPNRTLDEEANPLYNHMSLLQLPLLLRASTSEYFYLHGGLLLDLAMGNNSPLNAQSGIGLQAGIGFQYPFSNGIVLFANPTVKLHSIIPFQMDKNHNRLLESGVKLGLSYNF